MKLQITVIIAVLSLGIFVINSPVYADEKGSHKGSMMDGAMTAEVTESGAIRVGNAICPISKEKVGEMGDIVEYEHEGKIYNFCCKACLKDFKKDPDKYVKMVDEMMADEEAEVAEEAGEVEDGHGDHDH